MSNNYETEILTRLMNGEDANDIASDLVSALNSAIDAKSKREQAAKEAAEKAKNQEKESKLDGYAADLLTALKNYVSVAHPKMADELPAEAYSVKELRAVLDEGLKSLAAVAELANMLDSTSAVKPATKHPKTADESIDNFIKMFVDR